MRRFTRRPAQSLIALSLGLLALSLAAAVASAYKPTVIHAGNLIITASAKISPIAVPKDRRVPVTSTVAGSVSTVDGSHPPAATSFSVDVDKSFLVNARGLPTCWQHRIEARSTEAAKRACPDSIVGQGTAEAEVAFPEQPPIRARGPLLFFNGGIHGHKYLLIAHIYAAVPAPTAIVTAIEITRTHDGPYGLHAVAYLPKIAGGSGSITKFRFRLGRSFTYRGHKAGYIEAMCPDGRYLTRADVGFQDGSKYKAAIILPCRSRG